VSATAPPIGRARVPRRLAIRSPLVAFIVAVRPAAAIHRALDIPRRLQEPGETSVNVSEKRTRAQKIAPMWHDVDDRTITANFAFVACAYEKLAAN